MDIEESLLPSLTTRISKLSFLELLISMESRQRERYFPYYKSEQLLLVSSFCFLIIFKVLAFLNKGQRNNPVKTEIE